MKITCLEIRDHQEHRQSQLHARCMVAWSRRHRFRIAAWVAFFQFVCLLQETGVTCCSSGVHCATVCNMFLGRRIFSFKCFACCWTYKQKPDVVGMRPPATDNRPESSRSTKAQSCHSRQLKAYVVNIRPNRCTSQPGRIGLKSSSPYTVNDNSLSINSAGQDCYSVCLATSSRIRSFICSLRLNDTHSHAISQANPEV